MGQIQVVVELRSVNIIALADVSYWQFEQLTRSNRARGVDGGVSGSNYSNAVAPTLC